MIRRFIAVFLCIALTSAVSLASSEGGFGVKYSGGSLPTTVKTNDDLKLVVTGTEIKLSNKKGEVLLTLPPAAVTDLSYGQEVHRRIGTAAGLAVISLGIGALVAFSKSKKHYVGITWDNNGVKGGIALQADKNEFRGVIAALEGVTGKKAVDADEDAKKKNK
jgi:hypothetical protein